MRWEEIFGSSQYDFPIRPEPGSSFVGGPTFPDALVVSNAVHLPDRIIKQEMELDVSDDDGRSERIIVTRIAVEMPGGELVELKRSARKAAGDVVIDVSKCEACEMKIIPGEHVIVDGRAYHRRCVSEDEEKGDAHPGGDGADRSGDPADAGDGPRVKSEGSEDEDGNTRPTKEAKALTFARLRTVSMANTFDDRSASHLVTVCRIDEDHDLVTLWSRDSGSRSGTVPGRWENGLHPGKMPRRCDCDYISEKFFGRERVVSGRDLTIWNRLYEEALVGLGAEG